MDLPTILTVAHEPFRVFVWCAAVLIAKYIFGVLLLVLSRLLLHSPSHPEDYATPFFRDVPDAVKRKFDTRVVPPPVRTQFALQRNDVENLPFFLATAFLALLVQPDSPHLGPLMVVYTSARVVHHVVFVLRVALLRMTAYFVALAAHVGLLVLVFQAAVAAGPNPLPL